MGIARRKAGTVVSCPNCSGQVVVPAEDVVETSGEGATAPPDRGASEPLFERGDFDDLFRSGKGMGAPSPPAPPPPPPPRPLAPAAAPPQQQAPMPPPPRLDFAPPQPAPIPPPPPINGYVISSSMATLLSIALIVALALAFTAGLLVGRFYLQPSPEEIRPVPETR